MRSYRRDPSIVQDYAMHGQERVRRREPDDFDREDLQSQVLRRLNDGDDDMGLRQQDGDAAMGSINYIGLRR